MISKCINIKVKFNKSKLLKLIYQKQNRHIQNDTLKKWTLKSFGGLVAGCMTA